jgi:prolyl oligopeptidase
VAEGTAYPACCSRPSSPTPAVDPLHARKLAAALQHATSSDAPVLLRRETSVGHGAGR